MRSKELRKALTFRCSVRAMNLKAFRRMRACIRRRLFYGSLPGKKSIALLLMNAPDRRTKNYLRKKGVGCCPALGLKAGFGSSAEDP